MMVSDKLREWQLQGIDFITDFNTLKQEVEAGKALRHQFLVLDNRQNQVDWKWLNKYVNCLPYRIVIVGSAPDNERLKRTIIEVEWKEVEQHLDTHESLRLFLWQKWVQCHFGCYKLIVRWTPRYVMSVPGILTLLDQNCPASANQNGRYGLIYDHKKRPEEDNLFKTASFHHSFSSDEPIAEVFPKPQGNSQPTASQIVELLRLWEASAISVAVIDERIWLERDRQARHGVSKYADNSDFCLVLNAWKKRRVYLLDPDKAKRNFNEFVTNCLIPPEGAQFYDFVIIHQGIIDEIKKSIGDGFKKPWEGLREKARWVIIDTGRGRPDQAKEERLRWVEYSNLAECLVTFAADKLRLAHLLFALQAEFSGEGVE